MTHSPSQAPDTPEPGNYSQTANQARPRENSSTPPRLLSPQASHRHPQGGTDHARNSGHLGGETHLPHKHKLRQTHTHRLNAIPNLRTQKQTPAIRDSPQSPQKPAHREATVTPSQQSTAPGEPEAQLPDSAGPRCGPSLPAQNQSGFSVGQFKRLLREREGRRWGSGGGGNAKSGWGGPQPPAEERQHTLGFNHPRAKHCLIARI